MERMQDLLTWMHGPPQPTYLDTTNCLSAPSHLIRCRLRWDSEQLERVGVVVQELVPFLPEAGGDKHRVVQLPVLLLDDVLHPLGWQRPAEMDLLSAGGQILSHNLNTYTLETPSNSWGLSKTAELNEPIRVAVAEILQDVPDQLRIQLRRPPRLRAGLRLARPHPAAPRGPPWKQHEHLPLPPPTGVPA